MLERAKPRGRSKPISLEAINAELRNIRPERSPAEPLGLSFSTHLTLQKERRDVEIRSAALAWIQGFTRATRGADRAIAAAKRRPASAAH